MSDNENKEDLRVATWIFVKIFTNGAKYVFSSALAQARAQMEILAAEQRVRRGVNYVKYIDGNIERKNG